MLRNYFVLAAVAAGLAAGPIAARAQDAGALLDLAPWWAMLSLAAILPIFPLLAWDARGGQRPAGAI